jgi:hypothetical protein
VREEEKKKLCAERYFGEKTNQREREKEGRTVKELIK